MKFYKYGTFLLIALLMGFVGGHLLYYYAATPDEQAAFTRFVAGKTINVFSFVSSLIVLALLLGGYFLPSILAFSSRHHNRDAILLLNLFLGWSCLGWLIALVWSATKPPPK